NFPSPSVTAPPSPRLLCWKHKVFCKDSDTGAGLGGKPTKIVYVRFNSDLIPESVVAHSRRAGKKDQSALVRYLAQAHALQTFQWWSFVSSRANRRVPSRWLQIRRSNLRRRLYPKHVIAGSEHMTI